jgi:alpha-galactosidase
MTDNLLDLNIDAATTQPIEGGILLTGPRVTVNLSAAPKRLYRHGWQSWSLAAWLDPSRPPVPISSADLGNKDEDPLYTRSAKYTSAWVSAVELAGGQIVLLGALHLSGRIELDGSSLRGFYESGSGDWFLARGTEEEVFARYAKQLAERFGKTRFDKIPRVWCSWYSLYGWITETSFLNALDGLSDLPFDVVQVDDGWELNIGDWEANKKFPSGMTAIAEQIRRTGRTPGIWIAPFITTINSDLARQHPDWFLRNESGNMVKAGLTWNGIIYALDSSHPELLEWLDALIRKVRGWGYEYIKVDFLYAGAFPGIRKVDLPRETAYRQAMQVIRAAAGEAYILACGAPVIPSLGLCDGMRVGPDVTPFWINTPMSVWLNNPNHPSAQNSIRTSLHRLWLGSVVHTDPDVIYFRSRNNALTAEQKSYLQDLGLLSKFKATSDIPSWLTDAERASLREFLNNDPQIERLGRYCFRINGREVDFEPAISFPAPKKVPAKIATVLGLYDMFIHEAVPALREARRPRRK